MLQDKVSGDHGSDVVEESRQQDLRHVNHDKSNEGKAGNEMNRARRLSSAKHRQQPRERGVERRRHREPSQDDHRCEPENDA